MKKLFKKYPEATLVTLVVIFLVFIMGYYVWGIGDILFTLNRALNYTPPQQVSGFNLQDAAKIDWRGLAK